MGVDFIKKAAKPHRKCWDNGRKALGTADLFTQEPTCVGRSAPFDLVDNALLQVGDTVTVEADGNALVARQKLIEVARVKNPPSELLCAVVGSSGVAKGIIDQLHALSRVAEISLC